MAQRDSSLWQDASIFRADRFKSTFSTNHANSPNDAVNEPLPTLGFGCPIGHMHDSNQKNNTHQCPFMELAHPVIKDFLQILIQNYQWQIDPKVLNQIKTIENENIMDVDFNLNRLRGGVNAAEDMVPKIQGGIKFTSFTSNEL